MIDDKNNNDNKKETEATVKESDLNQEEIKNQEKKEETQETKENNQVETETVKNQNNDNKEEVKEEEKEETQEINENNQTETETVKNQNNDNKEEVKEEEKEDKETTDTKWYVVQAHSGFEDKAVENIKEAAKKNLYPIFLRNSKYQHVMLLKLKKEKKLVQKRNSFLDIC